MIMTIPRFFKLALEHHRAGRLDEAEALYRQVLQVQPNHPDALHFLGVIASQRGRHGRAAEYMQRAIRFCPTNPEFHNNLGAVYRAQGRLDEATAAYRQALALQPDYVESYYNLGNVLAEQGLWEEAAACFRETVARKPDHAEAHNNLANILKEQGHLEAAVAHYQRAIEIKPTDALTHKNLGGVLKKLSKPEEAADRYRQALAVEPTDAVKVLLATILPVILGSKEHLLEARRAFERRVDELLAQPLSIADPAREVAATSFYLAFHGLNDRDLQVKVAQLYERACPALLYTAPHCLRLKRRRKAGKIKIGFLSAFLSDHPIGRITRGLIADLSRERFSVYALFAAPASDDDTARFIRRNADKVVVLPEELETARKRVAKEALDILVYPEIGMDPASYFLAFSRLAPVQCVMPGHPVTTGIRNMDYFLSTEKCEPKEGDEHYSERLIKLKTAAFAYSDKPAIPDPLKSREQVGLDGEAHLYLCPEPLFKIHPDFDGMLAGILEADPRARLLLINGDNSHWAEALRERFARSMPRVADRVTLLPPQSGMERISLIAASDVVLDPIHVGGGDDAIREAFAVGTPVVTLPGAYMRGRVAYGCYTQMGMMDCVASTREEYVALAVRLGTDLGHREAIKAGILTGNHRLYEDHRVVKEYEQLFLKMVNDLEAG
jgi:predicted O-linked N-acetylglucosamine transferase (SPINDLY family)